MNALYQSLTPELYQLFDATSMKALPFTTIVDTSLVIQRRMSSDEQGSEQTHLSQGLPSHVNVNRATLRTLSEALSEYETNMTHYGFDVVKKSAAMGERLMGQNPLP